MGGRGALAWVVVCLAACRAIPSEEAAQLAARDRVLGPRLTAAPGTWEREMGRLVSPGWRAARTAPTLDVGARLPSHADGVVEVGIGRSEAYRLRFTPEGARPSPVEEHDGRAFYRDAFTSTDLLFVAVPERVEAVFLLRDATAPRAFAWRVALPAGLARGLSEAGGSLAFVDQAGRAQLRVPAAFAVDARGVRRGAQLSWSEGRLAVSLDTTGLTYPILLDPAVESVVWNQVGFPPQHGHGLAHDSVRHRTVLFGGQDLDARTWEWDGTSWTVRSATGPTGRSGSPLCFDPDRGRVVMFAGVSGGSFLGDTWEWDGTSWTRVATTGPSPRWGHSLVYDATRKRTLLFGGSDASGTFLRDTWEWDGAGWTRVATTGPSPRREAAMAYDRQRSRSVIFGGAASPTVSLADTWEWDGAAWTQRMVAGPSARQHATMGYDGARRRVLLFGGATTVNSGFFGDTWEWDGAAWTSRATTGPDARSTAMAYDDQRGRMVLVGGATLYSARSDTWEWDGAAWAQAKAGHPGPRGTHALAYDGQRRRLVLYGDGTDTWEWDGVSWDRRGTTGPNATANVAMAYDAARGETILFGGSSGTTKYAETWAWNGVSWKRVATMGPSAREGHAMAFDAGRSLVVLSGGGTYASPLTDTWEWNGASWTRAATTGPVAMFKHQLAYHPGLARTVMILGRGSASGTWLWNGATWTSLAVTSPEGGSALAYDSVRARVVAFDPWVQTTYEFNGATWQARHYAGPGGLNTTRIAYDSARRRVIMYGGEGDFWNGETTWEYHTRGGPCAAGADCDTGHCVDGVCCETAGCGSCQACDTAALPGVCQPVKATDDPDTCAGSRTCSAAGACLLAPGQPCVDAAACASGACVGGVCCDAPCTGRCQVCTRALGATADGVCTDAPPGYAGTPSCGAYVCTAAGACATGCLNDAACATGYFCELGGCVPRRSAGQACAGDGQCASGQCSGGICCSAPCAGACEACAPGTGACGVRPAGSAGNPSCLPFVCDGATGACPTSCVDDGGCAAGRYCDQGTCKTAQPAGAPCSSGRQCGSSFCVDGVCCTTACPGSCATCAGGSCAAAAAGSPGRAPVCAPYVCGGTSTDCPNTCSKDGDCVAGMTCVSGACSGKLPDGQPCGAGSDCVSGHCVANLCCDSQCTGDCRTCDLPGSLGKCTVAPDGSDPRGVCALKPGSAGCRATCKGGLCTYPDATSACQPRACATGSMLHNPWTCDGAGACVDRGFTDCAPYLCRGGDCPTSCTSAADCTSGHECKNGTCGLHRPLGAACGLASDCDAGFCVDGVCCESACLGQCLACDQPPSPGGLVDGRCRIVEGGNPHGDCSGEGTCGGYCRADGTCEMPGSERLCDVCTACDGQGRCRFAPVSGDDPACKVVPCGSLSTPCRKHQDLTAGRCISLRLCAGPNDPVGCTLAIDEADGTPCPEGACLAGECVPASVDAGTGAAPGRGCSYVPGGR